MVVEKTKHEFVDDNPYLVYSGEPESTLDNAGGGGVLNVEINEPVGTWSSDGPTTLTANVEPRVAYNAVINNDIVLVTVPMDSTILVFNLSVVNINASRITFTCSYSALNYLLTVDISKDAFYGRKIS